MRQLPLPASVQAGVFTITQAERAGWTRSAVRHAVRSGRLVVMRRGVLAVRPGAEAPWTRARRHHAQVAVAAALACPDNAVSHVAAAVLRQWPVLAVPARPCLSASPGRSHHVTGVHLHRGPLAPVDTARIGSCGVTGPARTAIDVAREHGSMAGLVVADAALRAGTSSGELTAALDRTRGPGLAHARRSLAWADGRAESALESCSRWWLRQAGLPLPDLQTELWAGGFLARVDAYWDAEGVVGEADGMEKYDDWRALRDEKRRQERLEQAGLIVVRWGWADLGGTAGEPAAVARWAARLRQALARGQAARRPRRWTARPRPSSGR